MRFWDSSAVVPLLVHEPASAVSTQLLEDDPRMLVWWLTPVECTSALTRLEREGALASADLSTALERLAELELAWDEVQPADIVRSRATRLLRTHSLRTAAALQLAAAIVASEDEPRTLPLVTLDDRLGFAAEREGFAVLPRPTRSAST